MKRYEGKWHCHEEMLFRGCVFAKADGRKWLEEAASKTAVFRANGNKGYSLRLLEEERKFLEDVGGEEHHIAMSKGYIRNGKTFVTEGPLYGKEHKISDILPVITINAGDSNDRSAKVSADIFDNDIRVIFVRLSINIRPVFIFLVQFVNTF